MLLIDSLDSLFYKTLQFKFAMQSILRFGGVLFLPSKSSELLEDIWKRSEAEFDLLRQNVGSSRDSGASR